jgi:hypothetical protein
MTIRLANLSYIANILAFFVALPITAATWYQALRARQELRRVRETVIHSENCLEFVDPDGTRVNLIPLETLRALPRPGDVVFLPGDGVGGDQAICTGAWRVERVEHIYTRVQRKGARPNEARLTQAVAHVISLHDLDANEFRETAHTSIS